MNLIYYLFRIPCSILYKILGADLSTRLAYSPVGKLVFHALIKGNKGLRIYDTTEDVKLELDASEAIGLGILHLGVINKLETELLKKIVKSGDVVIDVGTFVDGWHTLVASKLVGKIGHVYSFEPHPVYFKRLERNIKLNNLKNVTAEKIGLSDKKGISTFYEGSSGSSLIKSLAEDFVGPENVKTFKIRTTTLNSYTREKNIKNISLIKVDVEGVEMQVLRSADKILSLRDAPVLIVEVWDKYLQRAGSSKKELLKYLGKFGYKPYLFTSEGLLKYKSGDKTELFNFCFKKEL